MESSMSTTATALCFLAFLSATHVTALVGVDVENQVVNVTLVPLIESPRYKDVRLCERIQVSGLSRLKLGSYSSARRVTLVPIPRRLHKKFQICFHKNSSLGLCHCENDSWKSMQNDVLNSVISPYEDNYIDVMFVGGFSASEPVSVTVAVAEEFQRWRLLCLAFGFVLLVLAPIVSSWVPFYYSSSMAIGVCLVVVILLFQGMKLLPTGRKNAFYLMIYGSVLGAGSFLVNQFLEFVNSILVNFGISQEMHNPVAVFLLVGIILAGAGFGYWLVRKYVVSEDGTVDVGVAQFVKWGIRIIGVTFIFQSTLDTPLAVALLGSSLAIYYSITSMKWLRPRELTYSGNRSSWSWSNERTNKNPMQRAEFLSRSGATKTRGTLWNSPNSPSAWSGSPVKGVLSTFNQRVTRNRQDYYSTFHRTPNKKKFSKEEWKDLTEESTRQAVTELTSSPEFTDWIIKHSDRIQVLPNDSSDSSGSGFDSTNENAAESSSGLSFFNWSMHK
ncbi:uncharacterized protein LOC111390916 isoform X1 [Olea europaea var. sylvestris]|uniref:uncharacterized protein LOC111390916 isoform X1 n=1 Tax=Olea europaea var. sylvestris TaxID=158386 RepID=UPI000C1CDE2B|nr:uncharacterized protein LOC111390916 isoform X1 [Olea europaea var. sylvestris]